MKNTPPWIVGVGLVACAIALAIAWHYKQDVVFDIKFKNNMADEAGKLLGALLVIALFLERLLAVCNIIIFAQKEREIEGALLQVGNSREQYNELIKAYTNLEGEKDRLRVIWAFLMALVIAGAGVRTLAPLIMLPVVSPAEPFPLWTDPQKSFFSFVDIVLTAGILAGGSDGIAKLISTLKLQLSTIRSRLARQLWLRD